VFFSEHSVYIELSKVLHNTSLRCCHRSSALPLQEFAQFIWQVLTAGRPLTFWPSWLAWASNLPKLAATPTIAFYYSTQAKSYTHLPSYG